MTISLERSLRHMSWSNQKVFEAVAKLPDEALDSFITDPEWSAGRILQHICGGATWYVFRLEIEDWIDIPKIESMDDVRKVAALLKELDSKIISVASQEDRELEYRDEKDGPVIKRWFSTVLTQAVHHATEHRAQLIDALEFKGYRPINLDDIDLWAFDDFERKS